MRILLFDRPFPTNTAQWRIEEVKSFIAEKNTDVFTVSNKEIDYDYTMKNYYGLNDYNILIFSKDLNRFNRYNKNFNGTIYNDKFPGGFVFSKGKTFNILDYDIIYHIFYSRWKIFNELYPNIPQNKQIIHLYPGGKFKIEEFLTGKLLPKDVNIITTQRYYTDLLLENGYKPREILGGSFLQRSHVYNFRKKNTSKLIIGFSAAADRSSKGFGLYNECVNLYKKTYKNDNVEFIFIGNKNNITSKYITTYPLMPMENLKIIFDTVDVYINPEMGAFTNGWPLGVEAMLRGSVLLTTDPFNSAKHYSFSKDVIIIKNANDIVNNIKILYNDRDLLMKTSNKLQKNVNEFFSFINQQQKIFEYIDEVYEKNKTN